MTTDYWAGVPAVSDADAQDSTASRPRRAWPRTSRRTVFKTVGVLGGALALNLVGALPPARTRSASATVGSEHYNCANYDSWPGYNNNSAACVGGTYGQGFCGSDGWFRTDGNAYSYYYPVTACNGRNAWRWAHGRTYRCADGYYHVYGVGSTFYICSWPL
jgi:hypothetical protein